MSEMFGAKARQRSLARRGSLRKSGAARDLVMEVDAAREREMARKEVGRERGVDTKAPLSSREAAMEVFVGLCWEAYRSEFPTSTVSKRFVAGRCALKWETMEEEQRAAFHRMAEGAEQEGEAAPAGRSLKKPGKVQVGQGHPTPRADQSRLKMSEKKDTFINEVKEGIASVMDNTAEVGEEIKEDVLGNEEHPEESESKDVGWQTDPLYKLGDPDTQGVRKLILFYLVTKSAATLGYLAGRALHLGSLPEGRGLLAAGLATFGLLHATNLYSGSAAWGEEGRSTTEEQGEVLRQTDHNLWEPSSSSTPYFGPAAGPRVGDQGRKKKKAKDPNMPRAPSSSYLLYCREERARVREEVPELAGAAAPAMAKELGRRWSEADATTRAEFEARAAADRERYMVEVTAYRKGLAK